jgi:hypothetical protein
MNCKKVIGFCLTLLILVSNIGFAFTMHYCGNSVASVSVQSITNTASAEKSCCAKKAVKKHSCCKNKTVHFEKKSDHATLKAFSFEPIAFNILPDVKQEIITSQTSFINLPTATYCCDTHSPPLFKLFHHYIFYA